MSDSPTTHHETAPEDRIPLKEKIGLLLGMWGSPWAPVASLSAFMGVIELGISPALSSSFGFIGTILSWFIGPVAGQFADNFRSPWGRRRPLLAMTGIPMVLIGCAMYAFPRGTSELGMVIWFTVCGLLAMIPNTIYNVSLGALNTEATRDYHERARLSTFLAFFGTIYWLSMQWLYPLVKNRLPPLTVHVGKINLTLLKFPHFADALSGARWVILFFGVFSLVCCLFPVFLCQEKRYEQVKKKQAKGKLIPSLKEALKNRECLLIFSIRFFTFFCYYVVSGLGMYMNIYFVYGGDKAKGSLFAGFLGTAYMFSSSGSLFFYRWIEPKLGKSRVLRIAAGILMLSCVCKLFVYRPDMPWLQAIVQIANGFAITGLQMITGSMLGDIVDYDELLHKKRREALFGSIFDWAMGQGQMLGGLLCGFIMVWIGFNAKVNVQSWTTLHLMQFFYFFFPFCGAVFAFVMIGRYKLTEARMYEIRDELNRRRAEEKAEDEALEALAPGVADAG